MNTINIISRMKDICLEYDRRVVTLGRNDNFFYAYCKGYRLAVRKHDNRFVLLDIKAKEYVAEEFTRTEWNNIVREEIVKLDKLELLKEKI